MKKEVLTRRSFLFFSSITAASMLGINKVMGAINSNKKSSQFSTVPKLPWNINNYRFNIKEIKKQAYEMFYDGGCMFAVAATLLKTLQQNIGAPFNTLPLDMFRYGEGGIVGWGTICGTLNGSASVLNIVGKTKDDYTKLINALFDWYSNEKFPSKEHDSYAKFKNQPQSISKSPLCHVSVTTWCNTAHKTSLSPERADRCAKISGDVAGKLATMLNDYNDNKYIALYKPSEEYKNCVTCHTDAQNAYNLNVKAQMNCTTCHVDLTKIDPKNHP